MTVSEAVQARQSVRAFLDRPVERRLVEEILDLARFAPSGGNLQPWRVDVLSGAPLADLAREAVGDLEHRVSGRASEYPVYPPNLGEPWRTRRHRVGEQLYESIHIARDDRPGRLRQFARNYAFFGAPVALFFSIPRSFGLAQWAHLGMFIQTVMLLAVERGLGTCAQEAWAAAHDLVEKAVGLPDDWMLHCGLALGWPDREAPINLWRSERADVAEFATFRGFDDNAL